MGAGPTLLPQLPLKIFDKFGCRNREGKRRKRDNCQAKRELFPPSSSPSPPRGGGGASSRKGSPKYGGEGFPLRDFFLLSHAHTREKRVGSSRYRLGCGRNLFLGIMGASLYVGRASAGNGRSRGMEFLGGRRGQIFR